MSSGSGAGLNRVGNIGGTLLLKCGTAPTAVAAPTVAYGDATNDSYAVKTNGNPLCVEGMGFTKWTFQLMQSEQDATALVGFQFTIYGTVAPLAYELWELSHNPQKFLTNPGGIPVLPASAWFKLPGPSDQSGTGTDANPLTVTSPTLMSNRPLVAVRCVLTTAGTAGTAVVRAFLAP